MDLGRHTEVLNAIIPNASDVSFISNIEKYFDTIKEPTEDEAETKRVIKYIINNNLKEVYDIERAMAESSISPNLKKTIRPQTASYSANRKKEIIQGLYVEDTVTAYNPYIKDLIAAIDTMDREGGNAKGRKALNDMHTTIASMHSQSSMSKVKMSSGASSIVVLDPEDLNTEDVKVMANAITVAEKNKVKTLPIMDNMYGGGATPGNLHILGGISGHGKSLVMQNLSLYACKANKIEDLQIPDGLKPASVYFSYEMDLRQCMTRTIAWLNEPVPKINQGESLDSYTARLAEVVSIGFKKHDLKIPIIYVVHDSKNGEGFATAGDVENTIIELMTVKKIFPILISVDYLGYMDLRNKHQATNLGESGGDGATKLRLKARELRQVCKKYNIAGISAAQLNREAEDVRLRLEPYSTKIDTLHSIGSSMLAGSFMFRTELDALNFVNTFDVEIKNSDNEFKEIRTFVAISDEKDRDKQTCYKYSGRDKLSMHQYKSYTNALLNSPIKDIMKITSKAHVVAPLVGFRIDDSDYAMSIRNFFLGEKSDFISINNLNTMVTDQMTEEQINELEDEMF